MEHNIHGGSILGIALVARLLKEKRDNVFIYEASETILNSWRSKSINGIRINPGYHAIEMPRAKATVNLLNYICPELQTIELPAQRYYYIGGKLIKFDDSIDDLEKSEIRSEYEMLLAQKISGPESLLRTGIIKEAYNACEIRYGEKNAWNLFYPWFFPADFEFEDIEDEGQRFQNNVRNKLIKCKIIIPKYGVFEDMIYQLAEGLTNRGVNITYGIDSREIVNQVKAKKSEDARHYWCAPPLRYLNNNELKIIKPNELLFLKIGLVKLNKFNPQSITNASVSGMLRGVEILVADIRIPVLSRISFIQEKNRFYCMAELYSKEKDINDIRIPMEMVISKICRSDAELVDVIDLRTMPRFENKIEKGLINHITKKMVTNNVQLTSNTLGPVNIAKAFELISEFKTS